MCVCAYVCRWVSKTYVVTQETFPNNRRRMEVVQRRETLLTPIDNAITTMRNKTAELRDKVTLRGRKHKRVGGGKSDAY